MSDSDEEYTDEDYIDERVDEEEEKMYELRALNTKIKTESVSKCVKSILTGIDRVGGNL